MDLRNIAIHLRDLIAFDFYPTTAALAQSRMEALLEAYHESAPCDRPAPYEFKLDDALNGEDHVFIRQARQQDAFFLILALRWAQACIDPFNNSPKLETALKQIQYEFVVVCLDADYEAEFADPVQEAWSLHMVDLPWERHAFRQWRMGADTNGKRLDDADESGTLTSPEDDWDGAEEKEELELKVIVAEAIGDPDSSGGRDLKKRYGSSVGVPLPIQPITAFFTTVEEKLTARFPWAEAAINAIVGEIAVKYTYGDPRRSGLFEPLLLVGPPGSGKTHLLTYTAQLLGLPHRTFPVGGAGDSSGLLPVARGWSSAKPSGPFDVMHTTGCANPILILDELEKASTVDDTRNGNVHGTLLSMLNGSGQYYDTCLQTNTDLSYVTFWATANDLNGLRGPLADRFQVVQMTGPRTQDFDVILENVIADTVKALHLAKDVLPDLPVLHRQRMQAEFKRSNGSIRQLKKQYRLWLQDRATSTVAAGDVDQRENMTPLRG